MRRPVLVVLGVASIAAGIWLLAVAPEPVEHRNAWRPGEVVTVTQDTGNQTWEWSFRLPNEGNEPLRVRVDFTANISVERGDHEGGWRLRTLLLVDGVQHNDEDGLQMSGLAVAGNYERFILDHEWTLQPGRDSTVKATMRNIPTEIPGRDWQVDYDPMRFEVTTTTQALDWALAGPGTGLLLAGFVAVGAVAVPRAGLSTLRP